MVITRFLQISLLLLSTGLMSGCLTVYLAFEKHAGAFLVEVTGPKFIHIPDRQWDSKNNALVYFYRPYSDWAAEEIDAPSLFIDDRRYVSLRGNGYSWLEMAPGTRRITMRRPIGLLLGFEGIDEYSLSIIVDADFELEPGGIYYFRYSEVEPPAKPNPALDPDHPLASGDMQLVSAEVAFDEIVHTRFIEDEPPLAKNSAGTSIVETNIMDSFAKEREELEEQRDVELAELKDQGHWRSAKWYWPFGGGPTKRVKADRALRKLDKREQAYLATLASEEKEDSKWWWPF